MTRYFAIIGKHTNLIREELDNRNPQNIEIHKNNVITFDISSEKKLLPLAGVIKAGRVITQEELSKIPLKDNILGISEKRRAHTLKKKHKAKRYKITPLNKTDKEIKEQGIELIQIERDQIGVVKHYQNIALYECIDFEKPSTGMQVGMMPSKLTHLLINIATNAYSGNQSTTIYDPLCGFGTTCLVANALNHNSIGSDINITVAKPNIKRRKHTQRYKKKPTTLFKQDITLPLSKAFLTHTTSIVTEGWLGPIIKHKVTKNEVIQTYKKIEKIYTSLFNSIQKAKGSQTRNAVWCIPEYGELFEKEKNQCIENIQNKTSARIEDKNLLYKRKKQSIGRYVLLTSSN